jgi:pimeloyl-ACP methyl ester carboxylesterase
VIQPLFEHRLELAGYNTRVLELEGDGLPILMFHGYADSADTWRQSLALLAREGHRAVAVDLPGFGAADRLQPEAILPQLDEFALAAVRYAAGRPREPCWPSATRSVAASRSVWPSATATGWWASRA